ncbi:ribulose-phosphate 3-epimerase [Ohessyouella blattaphilus]|uniref:Ribulose-phosphate 3-epimerase n=1 Tax=Ohessyouella blattaphilus TaxID=2949333 RepID=A0ABT1EKW4_9FIRM|nr:ribulose-phosphate 3-epimerase [Ohessyouella blattaphilus]MCP1110412.1 ribulose-phosphate 3-epimerase [Ohessyouella blattaphilus]MCR8563806.1 ribulose-phosphate 3-epimerase [Ohessyouella blattaphilus]
MFTISPSIYSADLLDLRNVLKGLKGFEHLHLDIDDGNFVRGISFGMDTVKGIASSTNIPLDAHLEVLNPMDYIEPLVEAGVEMICAHVEALEFPSLFLSTVHQYQKKAGLALNIKTPVAFLEPYADQLDQIIFVSCEADVEGLPFRRGVLKKVADARCLFGDKVKIWVDGGVNESNLKSVISAGADGVVLGRAIFGSAEPVLEYERLLKQGRKYQEVKDEIS